MNRRVATLLMTLAASAVLLSTVGLEPTARYVWNVSASVPPGLYRLRPIGRLSVTELVAVRPPEPLAMFLCERGYLPRGIPMLKHVVALPGQTVCRDRLAIIVDNVEIGVAREHDSQGRPLPVWQGCVVVPDGAIFLMNWQSPDSLDGRYWGVLPLSAIVARAEALWTAGGD
jgi:conjugative transfer signal peptidase TraF